MGALTCYGLSMKRALFLALFLLAVLSNTSFAQEKKVDVFVTSWCPYCTKLEKFLKKQDIEYTRYDVETDLEGKKIFDEIGGEGIPVTRVGSAVVHGYDPDGIMAEVRSED